MKILVFVKTFANPTLTFIYNEVTELAQQHQVRVVTCEQKNADLFPFEDVVEIPFETNPRLAKIRYKIQTLDIELGFKKRSFKKRLQKEVEAFRPDVIHTHFGWESWLFLLNFSRTDIPVFISFHGFDASHKLRSDRYRKTLKTILQRPNIHPIFVSNFMQKQVEVSLDVVITKARILYYGTDTDFFKRQNYDYPRNPVTFLQVSSFAPKKGHEFTIRAFAQLLQRLEKSDFYQPSAAEPPLPPLLILAGDGPLRSAMIQLAEELGVSDSVKFPGLVNRQQAKALMERSHVFVHHSVTSKPVGDMEGIPNALMEAMAMEMPVLSTIHSGIPELIEDGVNGFLVAEEDITAYAQRLYEVLKWPYLPHNRAKIMAQFEKQQHARQLVEYYTNPQS
ncbi:MAG: glycosyltransferase family 4 protein [Spirosomaceae bacterium]|nr:glycosyltransferase family 4 protein [Spirosomataceae bacterium]